MYKTEVLTVMLLNIWVVIDGSSSNREYANYEIQLFIFGLQIGIDEYNIWL